MGDTPTPKPSTNTNSLHVDSLTSINYIRIPYQVRLNFKINIDCAWPSDTRAGIAGGLAS